MITSAADARAASILKKPADGPIFDSAIANTIENGIQEKILLGQFVAYFCFERRDTKKGVELKQTDGKYVLLTDLIDALTIRGHRHSFYAANTHKLKLHIAWD